MSEDATDDEPGADGSNQRDGVVYEISEGMRPSEAVVRAVGTLTDTTILELTPLYDVVNPQRIDEVVDISDMEEVIDGAELGGERSISFEYGGCLVRVTPDTVFARLDEG